MTFPGDLYTERAIQRSLQSDRLEGEFFKDTPAVLRRLAQLKEYYEASFALGLT